MNLLTERESLVEAVKREIRCVAPVPWYEVEQAAYLVARAHPSAEAEAVVAQEPEELPHTVTFPCPAQAEQV